MPERQFKTTEQYFTPSNGAREYVQAAQLQFQILDDLEQALNRTPHPEDATPESMLEFARFLAEQESEKLRANGGSERFDELLEHSPRESERLIEMAWEVRQSATVDMYQISTETLGGRSKSRQIINTERLTDELVAVLNKFNLSEVDARMLAELTQLEASELDELWHGFERVAHKAGQVGLARQKTEAKLEQKAENDELELKRQEQRAEAQNDALSSANILRYEAKKALLATDPRGYKRGSYSAVKEAYTELDGRSQWAAEPLIKLYEDHSDHDSQSFKNKLALLGEDLLSQAIGQAVFEHLKSGAGSDRNESYFNKIKLIAGIERAKDPHLSLSAHELHQLGAKILAEHRKRQKQVQLRDVRRRQVISAGQETWNGGKEIWKDFDASMDKAAAKIVELVTK